MVHRFLSDISNTVAGHARNAAFAVGELWAWARGNRRRVRVHGPSMLPTLRDGDDILIRSVAPSVGEVVVAQHPDPARSTVVVKRLDTVLSNGSLVVRSDNPDQGTDSRTFGPISPESVLGVATLRLNSLRPLSTVGRRSI